MRMLIAMGMVVGAMLLMGPLPTHAGPYTFTASLDGPSEAPANASPGTGFATVTLDPTAHILSVSATFSGLIGPTTVAHIHCCVAAPNGTAGVASMTPSFAGFPAGVTSGSYSNAFDTTLVSSFNAPFVNNNGGTVASAEAALLAGLLAGKAYFNIHSTAFPGGEIRGFFAQVPEPGTIGLLLIGLGLLGMTGVRRAR